MRRNIFQAQHLSLDDDRHIKRQSPTAMPRVRRSARAQRLHGRADSRDPFTGRSLERLTHRRGRKTFFRGLLSRIILQSICCHENVAACAPLLCLLGPAGLMILRKSLFAANDFSDSTDRISVIYTELWAIKSCSSSSFSSVDREPIILSVSGTHERDRGHIYRPDKQSRTRKTIKGVRAPC